MIFGQCDLGKTPYNSWGKPVWELFFISENLLQRNWNTQEKLQHSQNPTYLNFCAKLPTRNLCQQQNRKHSKNITATQKMTVIFGQCDPGKTPYNSWGKPVWELFFISENLLQRNWNTQKKSNIHKIQLISISVHKLHLENHATAK